MTEIKRWYEQVRFSSDGERLAVQLNDDRNVADVWIYAIARGILTPLTFGKEYSNVWPIWTPDGKRITFASNRTGQFNIFWMPADGSDKAEQLTTSQNWQWSRRPPST